MTKKIFFIALLLFANRMVFGQVLIALVFGDKFNNDKLEMGIQLAAQGFQFSGIAHDHLDVGFSFGAYLDIKWSDRLLLSNYFMFKSPKGGGDIPREYWFDQLESVSSDNISNKRHLTYFELTPMLRYQLSRSWSVAVGPQVALNVKALDIYQGKTDDGNVTYRYRIRDNITSMDTGVAIDVQWRLMKGKGLRINARFAQGFINTYKDRELGNAKNQTYLVGVGIPISGHKSN